MRILVIEDEPKIAQAVKRGLELKGFAVDVVYDADTGLPTPATRIMTLLY